MSFKEELQKRTGEIEEIIKEYLPEETGFQRTVLEAMNYSVLAGGKRLRPMLMQETFRMFGWSTTISPPWIMTSTGEERRRPTRFTGRPWAFWPETAF